MTTTASSSKGPPNDDDDSNDKDFSSSNFSHDEEDDSVMFRSRKSYPQRSNRPKLNYLDLERGVYDRHERRQSSWALGGPTRLNRHGRDDDSSRYSDDEDDDVLIDENDDDLLAGEKNKSTDDTDQIHRRLWCVCQKPWDHSRLMLRCDSCSNWYHGDCIGVTKEQARLLDMKGDQFVCPPCQGVTQHSTRKPARSSDESLMAKRKRIDGPSSNERRMGERNGGVTPSKTLTQFDPAKRPKTGIFFQRDSAIERSIHCIVHGCGNWARSDWVYCSPACIRRHINDTLQAIQRSKGGDNDNPPLREDVLLYENRTKKMLDRKLVPKVEDLCTWINQHPSYEIVKPSLRQSILLTANESKSPMQTGLARPTSITSRTPVTSTSTKPKLSWVPIAPNTKSVPIKKAPVPLTKQASHTASAAPTQNTADIRSKVPAALYEKLIIRIEKSGETAISNEEIRTVTERIEEEMYRVYGKVDNSYKNKFRSLLANISNMNNNFFYKQILSKEVTAKQIIAMKPEDMLPPEEKEKRKDEFEKEVQMIIKAEEQSAEEMARRGKVKITRQGLVDNDAVLPALKLKEQISTEEDEDEQNKEAKPSTSTNIDTTIKPKLLKKAEHASTSKPLVKTKKPVVSSSDVKPVVKTTSAAPDDTKPSMSAVEPIKLEPIPIEDSPVIAEPPPTPKIPSMEIQKPSPVQKTFSDASSSHFSSVDLDNDYIEPESPTGIDALLYDDDDDLNHTTTSQSRPSSIPQHQDSIGDNQEYLPSLPQPVRDDYNPLAASKSKHETPPLYQPTPISRSSTSAPQWRGMIVPPDSKIPCQSVSVYGDSDYLVRDIPEQLGILGRLRIGDLWDYIRDSIAVRDVIIITLTSSNNNESNAFSRYIDTMRTSGRAAVITKRTEPSTIRDMYILPSDSKACPPNVLATLALPTNLDMKQLFLVVIGSGKRTIKSIARTNESPAVQSLTYKPVSLQETAAVRDPRLSRAKDPRLAASQSTETTTNEPISVSTNTASVPSHITNEKSLKMISDSLERIRRASSTDTIQMIVVSTMEFLKSHGSEDLCPRFTSEIRGAIAEWQASKDASAAEAVLVGDNLNEENMEVDDEHDERFKKQAAAAAASEYNDVDYRFLDQDMDHRPAASKRVRHDDERRKSRFSDVAPGEGEGRKFQSIGDKDGRTSKRTSAGNEDSDLRLKDAAGSTSAR